MLRATDRNTRAVLYRSPKISSFTQDAIQMIAHDQGIRGDLQMPFNGSELSGTSVSSMHSCCGLPWEKTRSEMIQSISILEHNFCKLRMLVKRIILGVF